jgi:hypothetical protein
VPEADPLAELQARLDRTEKALKDTQAWGTKSSQRLAELDRERTLAIREYQKPEILSNNPELADAIRYVANDPTSQFAENDKQQNWRSTVEKAHPNIFDVGIDPELEADLIKRLESVGGSNADPLEAIREITEGKLQFAERQISKRFSIESAKQQAKTALSVPSQGGSAARTPIDVDLAEKNRILNMSDADFAREVKKAKGY